jgi:hypothetical protein
VAAGNKKHSIGNEIGEVTNTSLSARKLAARRRLSAGIGLCLLFFVQVLMMGAALAQSNPATYDPQGTGNQTFQDGQLTGQAGQTQGTAYNYNVPEVPFTNDVNTDSPVNVKGGTGTDGNNTWGIQRNVLFKIIGRDNPYGAASKQDDRFQPKVFIQGQQIDTNSSNIFEQQYKAEQQLTNNDTNLIIQAAEQSGTGALSGNPQGQVNNVVAQSLGSINETYRGMHQWFNDDLVGNLFGQIGQLIGKWISELIDGWIADAVQFLGSFLRVFVLNPNVAVNGLNGTQNDGISPYIRQGADVMYGIAVDLLLLLFILAIWKYWAEAAWRGGGNLMGPVGRLIFTAGLLLAFPTLYAFEIQITNEMIKAIYFNSTDQIGMLDSALASAVRGGILAGIGGLASAFAPLLGGAIGGGIGFMVGEVFAFAGLVVFLVLGGILIAELVYILVLKAIQTALLTAQYMFAPIFLVFFATPDTENVASGFIKAWVETSLWTFVWVGLLKILVIIMFSDYNPWGKILITVGILQMMIQVPSFLARAQISPMSDFISAGLITGGLMKMFGWMGKTASSRLQQGLGYYLNDRLGQQGYQATTKNAVPDIPNQSGSYYDKLKSLREKANGQDKNKPPGGPGGPGDPKNALNQQRLRTDRHGNPIDPLTNKALKRDANGNLVNADGSPLSEAQRAALNLPPTKNLTTPNTPTPGTTPNGGVPGPTAPGGAGAAGTPTTPAANAANAAGKKPGDGTQLDKIPAAQLNKTLDQMKKDGHLTDDQANKIRAQVGQGKTLGQAAAAAGVGAAAVGAMAASLGEKVGTPGGATGTPPTKAGEKKDQEQQLNLFGPDEQHPGAKPGAPKQPQVTTDGKPVNANAGQVGKDTPLDKIPAGQLNNKLDQMKKDGLINDDQANKIRAQVGQGKTLGQAAAAAGLGAAAAGAMAASLGDKLGGTTGTPPGKGTGKEGEQQMSLFGADELDGKQTKTGQPTVTADGKNVPPGAAAANTQLDKIPNLDQKLAQWRKEGLITDQQAQNIKASVAPGKSLGQAAAAAGVGAAAAGVMAASLGAAEGLKHAGAGPAGKNADQQMNLPGMDEHHSAQVKTGGQTTVDGGKPGAAATAASAHGAETAKQLDPALKGMVQRGQATEQQVQNFKAHLGAGKSVADAAKAAGLGAAIGGAAGAAMAHGGPEPKTAGGKPVDQQMTLPGMEDPRVASAMRTHQNLDLGGVKPTEATAQGVDRVASLDNAIKGMVQRGQMSPEQSSTLRAQLAQGKSVAAAAAAAGVGAAFGGAAAAGMHAAGPDAKGAAGKTEHQAMLPGMDVEQQRHAGPVKNPNNVDLGLGTVKPESVGLTQAGVDRVASLDNALKGMVAKGTISPAQDTTFRAQLAQGKSVAAAAAAAGIGGAIGAAGVAGMQGAAGDLKQPPGKHEQQMTLPGLEDPRVASVMRSNPNLDLGGVKPMDASAPGVERLAQADNAIKGAVQRGQMTQEQSSTLRAQLAQGKSMSAASAAAGLGAGIGAGLGAAAAGLHQGAQAGGHTTSKQDQQMTLPGMDDPVSQTLRNHPNLDLGMKPDPSVVTPAGIERVAAVDGALKGMVSRGQISHQQDLTMRAQLAQGKSMSQAAAAAGISAPIAAHGLQAGVPGEARGAAGKQEQQMNLPGMEDPGVASVMRTNPNLDLGGVRPMDATPAGVERLSQMDGAIKGMVSRGQMTHTQEQTLRAQMAQGKSVAAAAAAAGVGAAFGGAAAAGMHAAGTDAKGAAGKSEHQMSFPGMDVEQPAHAPVRVNPSLDLGGLKGSDPSLTQHGVDNVAKLDNQLRGMVSSGKITPQQDATFRAQLAQGRSLAQASAAARMDGSVSTPAGGIAAGASSAAGPAGKAPDQQMHLPFEHSDERVNNTLRANPNLDLGGLTRENPSITAGGVDNVAKLDNQLKGMVSSGKISQQQDQTIRAQLAQGKSVASATAAAGIGAAAGAFAAGALPGAAPSDMRTTGKSEGHVTVPGAEQDSRIASIMHSNPSLDLGGLKPDGGVATPAGVERVSQLDGALKGMTSRGQITHSQEQQLRAQIAQGKTLGAAASAVGISTPMGGISTAGMHAGAPGDVKTAGKSEQQMTLPGMDVEQQSRSGPVHVNSNLDIGGLKPNDMFLSQAGVERVGQLDNALKGMVSRGEISQGQSSTIRAELAQGRSVASAFASAGAGVAMGSAIGAGMNRVAGNAPDARTHDQVMHAQGGEVSAHTHQRTDLDLGGFRHDAPEVTRGGAERVAQLDGALKGMVSRGEISQTQAATIRGELAQGRTLEQATMAANYTAPGSGGSGSGGSVPGGNITAHGGTISQPDGTRHTTLTPDVQHLPGPTPPPGARVDGTLHTTGSAPAGHSDATLRGTVQSSGSAPAGHSDATLRGTVQSSGSAPAGHSDATLHGTAHESGSAPVGHTDATMHVSGSTTPGGTDTTIRTVSDSSGTAPAGGHGTTRFESGSTPHTAAGGGGLGGPTPPPTTPTNTPASTPTSGGSQTLHTTGSGATPQSGQQDLTIQQHVGKMSLEQQRTWASLVQAGINPHVAVGLTHGHHDAATMASGGGGGGGGNGGDGNSRMNIANDPQLSQISHLKNPTAEGFDQSGLWMVSGGRAAPADIRNLKLQVRFGQGQNGKVWGSTRGGYSRIDMPDGAEENPAQMAGMFAVAGYSQEINNDSAAMDAARSAAVESGYHKPRGFVQGLAANLNQAFGGTWASTGLGKAQFQNSIYTAAVQGSESYIRGRQGNAYTQYLTSRFGEWDDEKMDTLTMISADPEAAESAWNAGITQATDRLIASGTKISAANRGAALNPYCASLRPAAAGSAIRSMVIHSMGDQRVIDAARDEGYGEDVIGFANTSEGGILVGEVLRNMNPETARAIHETFLVTNGADMSEHIVGAVSNLAIQNSIPAGVAYKALSSNIGGFAANYMGNSAFRGATTFDGVHQTCIEQYGPQAGTVAYDQIVRVANDRAQLGISAAGRNFTDVDVSSAFDGTIEDVGGWAAVTGDVISRDRGQTAASSFGIALQRFGSNGIDSRAASTVFRYVQDGNTGANTLSAQEITIAERLVDAGAPRLSQSLIQTTRQCDADGSRGIDIGTLQQIAYSIDHRDIRPDQAAAALQVLQDGGTISRESVEVVAIRQSSGSYSSGNSKAVVNLVSNGTMQSAAAASASYDLCVRAEASAHNAARVANGQSANIDIGQSIGSIENQLYQESGGTITPDVIAGKITNMKVSSGCDDRQLADPVTFDAQYEAMHDPGASSHRGQALRITELMHGHQSLGDQDLVGNYEMFLENGIPPKDLTDGYVGRQRLWAGTALAQAMKPVSEGGYGRPAGKSQPPSFDTKTLDRIRRDTRFVMKYARPDNPPTMDFSLFDDLWRP